MSASRTPTFLAHAAHGHRQRGGDQVLPTPPLPLSQHIARLRQYSRRPRLRPLLCRPATPLARISSTCCCRSMSMVREDVLAGCGQDLPVSASVSHWEEMILPLSLRLMARVPEVPFEIGLEGGLRTGDAHVVVHGVPALFLVGGPRFTGNGAGVAQQMGGVISVLYLRTLVVSISTPGRFSSFTR